MQRFILIRALQSIITLLALSMAVFFGSNLSGDLALVLVLSTPDATPAEIEQLRKNLGLDDPPYIRYANYLAGAFQGDFGRSGIERRPVVDMLVERIPATLQLAAAGLLLAVVLGVPLGIIAAIRRDSIIDKFAKVFAIIGMSAPQFWIAIMLIMFFGAYLKVLPTFGKGA
jgi:peptide/nickel transport system permease protein